MNRFLGVGHLDELVDRLCWEHVEDRTVEPRNRWMLNAAFICELHAWFVCTVRLMQNYRATLVQSDPSEVSSPECLLPIRHSASYCHCSVLGLYCQLEYPWYDCLCFSRMHISGLGLPLMRCCCLRSDASPNRVCVCKQNLSPTCGKKNKPKRKRKRKRKNKKNSHSV